jgi:hypothetical protein
VVSGGQVVACPGDYDLAGYDLVLQGEVTVMPSAGVGTATLSSSAAGSELVVTKGSRATVQQLDLSGLGMRAEQAERVELTEVTADLVAEARLEAREVVITDTSWLADDAYVTTAPALTLVNVDDGQLLDVLMAGLVDRVGLRVERSRGGANYVEVQSSEISSFLSAVEVDAPTYTTIVYLGDSWLSGNGPPNVPHDGAGLRILGNEAVVESGGLQITDNFADDGGAVYMNGGFLYLEDAEVVRNHATQGQGGGLSLWSAGPFLVEGVNVDMEPGGGGDNMPFDVTVDGVGTSFGDGAYFECTPGGCY